MDPVEAYLLVALSVFAVNLLPAYGPPTWAVLVLWFLHAHLSAPVLVVVGAVSAACGRWVLATAARRLVDHIPARWQENVNAAADRLLAHRGRALLGVGLFALSPVPSAQLFEAAGMLKVALLPLTAAFFAGRIVSYSLYLGGAHAFQQTDAGKLLLSSLTSPWALAVESVMLVGLVLLARIDWAGRGRAPSSGPR